MLVGLRDAVNDGRVAGVGRGGVVQLTAKVDDFHDGSFLKLGLSSSLRGAKRRSNPFFLCVVRWIASWSLSSGAHSRDPLARNDGLGSDRLDACLDDNV